MSCTSFCKFYITLPFVWKSFQCLAIEDESAQRSGHKVIDAIIDTITRKDDSNVNENLGDGRIDYLCPVTTNLDLNSFDTEAYNAFSTNLLDNIGALPKFIKSFRSLEFDDWGFTYNQVKSKMYEWKKQHYLNELPLNNALIYESASGIGLNLLMTLEIIQENSSPKLTNITLYGNEYVPASTEISRRLTNPKNTDTYIFDSVHGRMGKFCTADSLNLNSFVPANSFDLVFTGYLTPNENPLGFHGEDVMEIHDQYCDLCTSDNYQDKLLAEKAQGKNNDWYGKWIGEMVHIAKPGAPIIIEQVSRPVCEEPYDWGGVSRTTFWTNETIQKYNWDVDPTSFQFADDQIFSRHRYHVFMRKNKLKSPVMSSSSSPFRIEKSDSIKEKRDHEDL